MAHDDNVVSEENAESEDKKVEETQAQGRKETDKKEQKVIDRLQQELQETKAKADANWNEYLRACAELENTKRRMLRDIENAHKYAVEKFVAEMLPVKDSLELGLQASKEHGNTQKLLEGTELTLKMFNDTVAKFGVEIIDPFDQPFNPEFHQAVSMQESPSKPANTVMAVMQKGYTLNGRLVRPAMVVVSKGPARQDNADPQGGAEKVGTNIDEQA